MSESTLTTTSDVRLDRLEARVDGIEEKIATNHRETLAAIEASRGEINNGATVKLIGAGAILLTAAGTAINALAPVLPDVFRARYATPVVVTVTAPAASASGAP